MLLGMPVLTNAGFQVLRGALDAFTRIQKQLAPPASADEGLVEAIRQLVRHTNRRAPGVLPPLNPLEYRPVSGGRASLEGLRAYVATAVSFLSVAIEKEGLLSKEQLLAEIEDLVRTMPPRATIRHETEENLAWLGRLSAVIEKWNPLKGGLLMDSLHQFNEMNAQQTREGFRGLMTLLHQARHDLRMETLGPANVVVAPRMVFDYFDELRKIIEAARQDLLFVDPYLDAEFVSRYLPHVAAGVTTRLLAREKLAKLLPAVDAFAQQSGMRIEVRSVSGFHDRYVFVDRASCYQSGASFKDGAKSAPTTVTQIMDAIASVLKTYEDLWSRAHVER